MYPGKVGGVSRRRFAEMLASAGALAALIPGTRSSAADGVASPTGGHMQLQRFVDDCIHANSSVDPQAAVLEVLARAVRQPAALLAALGEPAEAGIAVLHRSDSLTIFNATWTPRMNLMPHNHRMWANIGIYTGREDNILWRAGPQRIEAFGARALFAGDAVALPLDVIHSVTNPLPRFTGGIHIYGGDFFATTRSQWDPETLQEGPSDGAAIRAIFELENQRLRQQG